MIIKDIQRVKTHETRKETEYAQCIGCRVSLEHPVTIGECALFIFQDDAGGYIRTSTVRNWYTTENDELVIETRNSRYVLIE